MSAPPTRTTPLANGPRPRAGAHSRGEARPPLVLIAEDDADTRLMLKTLLEMKGYRTAEAADGQQAVERAADVRPDLILVDLQLPRLNGFAVTRYVRQHEELRRVPIVIVSGHDPARHLNLARAAGCNAYLQKPIDFDALDGLLNDLLQYKH